MILIHVSMMSVTVSETILTILDGRPHGDRSWTESFAQLVGTVLSLWDASALDAAGQDGEVAPTFINLSDASIRMVKSIRGQISAFVDLRACRSRLFQLVLSP